MVLTHRDKLTDKERMTLKRCRTPDNIVIVPELAHFGLALRFPQVRKNMIEGFKNHIKDCDSWYCQAVKDHPIELFDVFLYELNEVNGRPECQLN